MTVLLVLAAVLTGVRIGSYREFQRYLCKNCDCTLAHAATVLEQFEETEGIDAVSLSFPRGAEPDEIEETIRAVGSL